MGRELMIWVSDKFRWFGQHSVKGFYFYIHDWIVVWLGCWHFHSWDNGSQPFSFRIGKSLHGTHIPYASKSVIDGHPKPVIITVIIL